MKPTHRRALALNLAASLAASATAFAGAACSEPLRLKPQPGTYAYRYAVDENIVGTGMRGYRTDFDLVVGRDGSIDAVIRASQEFDGKTWNKVTPADDCRAKMHAPKDALAQARLWPLAAGAAGGLGAQFLDACAPSGVFFPLTDILNVAVISVSGRFGVDKLHKAGDTARYDGFTANYDRNGETLKEVAHGGAVKLIALDRKHTVIDWEPDMADLDLDEHAGGQLIHLNGTEHYAFRLELDRHTGALVRARTTYDDLDLTVHMAGLPEGQAPKQKISRTVTIEPR
jgi:hypothetical protein